MTKKESKEKGTVKGTVKISSHMATIAQQMAKRESKEKEPKKIGILKNVPSVGALAQKPTTESKKKLSCASPTQPKQPNKTIPSGSIPKIGSLSLMNEKNEKQKQKQREELESPSEEFENPTDEDQMFEEEDDEEETEEQSDEEEQTEEEKYQAAKNAEYLACIEKIISSQTEKMAETHPIAKRISKNGALLSNEQIHSWATGVQKFVQHIVECNLELDHSNKNDEDGNPTTTQVTPSDIFSSYKFSTGSKEKCLWHVEYAKTALQAIESMNETSD